MNGSDPGPHSDYLWDRTGAPDDDVRELEQLLGPYRYSRPMELLTTASGPLGLAGAGWTALAALAAGVSLLVTTSQFADEPPEVIGCVAAHGDDAWRVRTTSGQPRCGGGLVGDDVRLAVGGWLETDAESAAELVVADIGHVSVRPNSRLRLVTSRPSEHRLELSRGGIHAVVDAPPRLFLVDTPSTTVVDLGCEYSLTVDDSGDAELHVTGGSVSLERGGREVFVPAGTRCVTRSDRGPGTPYRDDAPEAFRAAVAAFDSGAPGAVDTVLAHATDQDVITLWHLIPQVEGDARRRVGARLARDVALPAGVSTHQILVADPRALARWRQRVEDVWFGDEDDPEGESPQEGRTIVEW